MILISIYLILFKPNEIKSYIIYYKSKYICFIFLLVIDLISMRETPMQLINLLFVLKKKIQEFEKNFSLGLSDFKGF
jgi:hypothetical protein